MESGHRCPDDSRQLWATSGRQYPLECTNWAQSYQRSQQQALPTMREQVIVSRIRVQYPAAGFRKREGREEEYAVGCYRKDRDGVRE